MSDSPVATATHGLELRHHFVDEEQQRNTVTFGMWLFLVTEIMFFGGMFCAYLLYRTRHFNEFAAGSRSLSTWLGGVNTAVLLVSSWTMAMAVRSAQLGKKKLLCLFIALTMIFGATFLGVKAVEYHDKFVEHHVPGPDFNFIQEVKAGETPLPINQHTMQMFFSVYFAMTGMHALHMVIGLGLMTYLLIKSARGAYSAKYYTPVEMSGLYWHFVDIVWIYLFPLLYLIDVHK